MTGEPPLIPSRIVIHSDLFIGGPSYPGANDTCASSSTGLDYYENTYAVNENCGTLSALQDFKTQVLMHERFHESGARACLRSSTGRQAMADMERITGSEADVRSNWESKWSEFYMDHFITSGMARTAFASLSPIWNYVFSSWELPILHGSGHPPDDAFGC